MSKQTIFISAEINTFAQLQDAMNRAVATLAGRTNPFNVTLIDTLRLQVIEETLTDGSTVYDVRVIED